jgi:hypothetical protein
MARATALERSSVFAKPTWLQWGEAALVLAVAMIPRIWLTGSLTPQFYQQLALDRPLEFELLAQRSPSS